MTCLNELEIILNKKSSFFKKICIVTDSENDQIIHLHY